MTTYSDSGVNIELGDTVSEILYNAAKETWKNRKGLLGEVFEPQDDFSGLRYIHLDRLPRKAVLGMGMDGVGTKIEIAERMNDHSTIAHDLLAMVVEDAEMRGAEGIIVGTILDAKTLGKGDEYIEMVRQLGKGYISAARAANVAVVTGETAELGNRVGGYGSDSFISMFVNKYISVNLREENLSSMKALSAYAVEQDQEARELLLKDMNEMENRFVYEMERLRTLNYNWGASCIWIAQEDRMLDGSLIKEGDDIVAFGENGFRSNGLSLVRRISEKKFGPKWHEIPFWDSNSNLGNYVLEPSKIYTRAIAPLLGLDLPGGDRVVHGIVHVTGGGVPGKLGRVLKPSRKTSTPLGAIIFNPMEPPEIMKFYQHLGNVSDEEAYTTWNMGQGMLVITRDSDTVKKSALENGIESKVVGAVTKGDEIVIESRGQYSRNKHLKYSLE